MSRAVTVGLGVLCMLVVFLVVGYLWLAVWSRCDATIYATGFSEAKFSQVRAGMSRKDVERLLGKPLSNLEGLPASWNAASSNSFYAYLDRSKIPEDDRVTNTWFELREVDFDEHGRVEKTVSSTEQFE